MSESPSGDAKALRYWSRMGNRPPAVDNLICENCGAPFHLKPSAISKGRGKFCSKDCYSAYQTTVCGANHPLYGRKLSDGGPLRPCLECGLMFRHRRTRVKFCSRPCFHAWVAKSNRTDGGNRQLLKTGYIRLTLPSGERVSEHRWLWEQAFGSIPKGSHIHHMNHDKTDNRLENLELVTPAEHAVRHDRKCKPGCQCGRHHRKKNTQ